MKKRQLLEPKVKAFLIGACILGLAASIYIGDNLVRFLIELGEIKWN